LLIIFIDTVNVYASSSATQLIVTNVDWNCCYGHCLHINIFWLTNRLLQS